MRRAPTCSQMLIPEVDGKVQELFNYLPASAVPEELGGSYPFDFEAWKASLQ